MGRRTRAELEAENLVLYREVEEIRDRLDALLEDEEAEDDDEGYGDEDGDLEADASDEAEDED
ncbi:MAG: hypothetical protein AMS25_09075 [Gemmatimonas sp. SM23_52]|nr:MAG: hypothetical protein AMS25_09075 [Gemmatimonas sp. SM23_52]